MFDHQFFTRDKGENPGVNVDLSARCGLECPRCQRQTYFSSNKDIPGHDLTVDDFVKITDYFKSINFCGQLSDPIHHPKFAEILKHLYDRNIDAIIHNASSARPKEYYIKCFKAHPNARWVFGIDGLPEESNMYRINQDGEKLYRVMLEAKKHLKQTPSWQFIVFSYNEHNLEKAKKMAVDEGLMFIVLHSSRWMGEDDPLRPKEKEYNLGYKGYIRPDVRQET